MKDEVIKRTSYRVEITKTEVVEREILENYILKRTPTLKKARDYGNGEEVINAEEWSGPQPGIKTEDRKTELLDMQVESLDLPKVIGAILGKE